MNTKHQLTAQDIAMLPEYCTSWFSVYCQQKGYSELLTLPQLETLFFFIMPVREEATPDGFSVFKQVIETEDFFLGIQYDEYIDALWNATMQRIKQLVTLSQL